MNVAVTGATGRMGRAVLAAADARRDVTVAFGIAPDPGRDRIDGARVYVPRELPTLLEDQRPNALIDFSVPDAAARAVEACGDAAVPAVVGTTGFDGDQVDRLHTVAESIPVLKASNFARGIQAVLRALDPVVAGLPGYDIEVTETHHNRKRDAPSGTANTILDRIDGIRGGAPRVHGREGNRPRDGDEIGVHSRRAGNVRGEHEILVAGNDEAVSITHRAGSRRVFAEGALDAAVWIAGQPPGWYGFADVLDDEQ